MIKFLIIVAAWFILMKFVLPRLGMPTWMSSVCRVGDRPAKTPKDGLEVAAPDETDDAPAAKR
jgi:p-aminobenzoyl-glutamate transporter AbgT